MTRIYDILSGNSLKSIIAKDFPQIRSVGPVAYERDGYSGSIFSHHGKFDNHAFEVYGKSLNNTVSDVFDDNYHSEYKEVVLDYDKAYLDENDYIFVVASGVADGKSFVSVTRLSADLDYWKYASESETLPESALDVMKTLCEYDDEPVCVIESTLYM